MAATIVRVDLRSDTLRLYLDDRDGGRLRRLDWLARDRAQQGEQLLFAMNAGMYHPDLGPVGLLVQAGRERAPLNRGRGGGNFFLKPNGVLAVTAAGRALVLETADFAKVDEPVRLATQSGPLLVRAGAIHPAFRAGSNSRLIRNGAGVASPHEIVFAISDGALNLHEFATLFRDVLKCPDALYLDGNVSSLWAPALGRTDFRRELGPMLGVTVPGPAPAPDPAAPPTPSRTP